MVSNDTDGTSLDLQRVCINGLHEDAVPCLINGSWDGELVFVEDLARPSYSSAQRPCRAH